MITVLKNLHLSMIENFDLAKTDGGKLLCLSSFLPSLLRIAPFVTNKLALHKVKISKRHLQKLVVSLNLATSLSFHSCEINSEGVFFPKDLKTKLKNILFDT
mmetsp:Transcript_10151/g.10023  ORF Transcript_10151/g.10023 Transcript_10151/m.10023 type:complete len:102 (-) Transcript_10151:276-581(-)